MILENNVLTLYDPEKEIVVCADASPLGVGAILSHVVDGVERPVLFASSTLSPAEQNYSQLHREALAIIFAVTRFHKYLYGKQFTLCSDSEALKEIFNPTKGTSVVSASRLQRWSVTLSMYKYKFIHRPAREMRHVDALSRLPLPEPTGVDDEPINRLSEDFPLDFKKIKVAQKDDLLLRELFNCVHDGWPRKVPEFLKAYHKIRSNFSIEDDALFFCDRIVVPDGLKNKVLGIVHDPHCGIVRMKMNARSYVWWKNINEDIENFVSSCATCQQTQNSRNARDTVEWPETTRPFERIHVDFFHFENSTFLVIVDSFSKFIDVKEMNKTNAANLIAKMREFFAYFGLPDQIVSDNGPPFGSKEFVEFGELNGIKMTRIPPYHPESNGLAERAVQTIKKVFKKVLIDSPKHKKMNMSELICKFIITYNNTYSTVTAKTPNDMVFSFKQRTLLSQMNLKVNQKQMSDCKPKKDIKFVPEKPQEKNMFVKNEKVMYRNVFKSYLKWIPARVLKRVSFCTYLINVNDNVKFVHRDQIRKSTLEDKFHPDYLIYKNDYVLDNTVTDNEKTDKKRKRSSEGNLSSPKKLRRSTRNKKPPLRFDFRSYMIY